MDILKLTESADAYEQATRVSLQMLWPDLPPIAVLVVPRHDRPFVLALALALLQDLY